MLKVPRVSSLQYLGKKEVTDIFFLHADEHQSFLEVDTIVLVVMAMHAQSTQSNMFAISLQYLKKVVSEEVDFFHTDKHQNVLHADKHQNFLHADKHQNFQQVDTPFL